MGQYWRPINLDKKEFVNPHRLGSGLKLWEQLANHPGVGEALVILCAAMPEQRGGGDFDLPDPMTGWYGEVARRTIGRWAGDRIALIGDYAEPGDISSSDVNAREICDDLENYRDMSDDVARVIEHELRGRFVGHGWEKVG